MSAKDLQARHKLSVAKLLTVRDYRSHLRRLLYRRFYAVCHWTILLSEVFSDENVVSTVAC